MTHEYRIAADALKSAYAEGAIAPLRQWLDPEDVEGAYLVQAITRAAWLAEGRKLVGRKIGLTSPAGRAALSADEPNFGLLFDDMRLVDDATLVPSRTIAPRVEGEIALVLGAALDDPDASDERIASAVASVHAAIEICDSRIADWEMRLADTIADNGSAGHFVLSEDRTTVSADLFSCGMVLEVDGKVAAMGAGAAALGHPLSALGWLARRLARNNDPLCAGDIVLTGSLGIPVAIAPGCRVSVTIGGIGNCSFHYRDR